MIRVMFHESLKEMNVSPSNVPKSDGKTCVCLFYVCVRGAGYLLEQVLYSFDSRSMFSYHLPVNDCLTCYVSLSP